MSQTDIAFVREQGVEFAVVCVSDFVVETPHEREGAYQAWTADSGEGGQAFHLKADSESGRWRTAFR